jgi:prepilin-type N-terminal cleavage/methylation domain-containing protein
MRGYLKPERGFTLTEIIVVLIIVGILVTLAISQFGPSRERALGKEAIANLKLIAAAEKIYRIENSFYYPNSGSQTSVSIINSNLNLFLSEKNWDYRITDGTSGESFTADADRIDTGSGVYKDCVYSISNSNIDGEPSKSSTTLCP